MRKMGALRRQIKIHGFRTIIIGCCLLWITTMQTSCDDDPANTDEQINSNTVECQTETDCGEGEICVDSICTSACSTPSDCTSIGMTCRDGECRPPVCGNSVVEIGETCDGNCPTTCDDENACTQDTLTGTAGECNVVCSQTTITTCTNGDGCCPATCTAATDSDCSSASVITLEAEEGTTVGQMQSQSESLADPACANAWIEVPQGVNNFSWNPASPTLPPHRAELSVTVPANGTYYVSLRLAAPSGSQDALYVGFDAADMRRVYPSADYAYDSSWVWVSAVEGDTDRLVFPGLTAGNHTLIIGHAETGVRCDRIVVASSRDADFEKTCGSSAPQSVCGDGQITGSEVCDTNGNLLNGATCASLGYAGDGLACSADCLSFDVTQCETSQTGDGCIPGDASCMESFTLTRGAYSGSSTPAVLIVDRLGWSAEDGNENTGRGTLHWALTRPYPRVILFEVSGTIDMRELDNIIAIEAPYVTVAGQTAPSPGITIRGVATRVRTHDVIIKHLRFRLGHDYGGRTDDVLHVEGASDVIIDHNSLSWSVDELSGHVGDDDINQRITWTHNFLTEPLENRDAHSGGESRHNFAMITYYVDQVTIAKNLIAYSRDRNPMIRSGRSVIYNNFMFNHDKAGVSYLWHENENQDIDITWTISSYIGNVIIPFENSHPTSRYAGRVYQGIDLTASEIFAEDNICDNCQNAQTAAATFRPDGGLTLEQITPIFVDASPIDLNRFDILPSSQVENYVLTSAGARPADRDAVDIRIVTQISNREGAQIYSEEDVGGFPTLAENVRPLTSMAGYPGNDPHDDADTDGWTNLEEWLRDQSQIVEN